MHQWQQWADGMTECATGDRRFEQEGSWRCFVRDIGRVQTVQRDRVRVSVNKPQQSVLSTQELGSHFQEFGPCLAEYSAVTTIRHNPEA
jgi:hypothetical protein